MTRQFCIEKLGLSESEANGTIEQALSEITLAADFDRRNEIGKAVIQLDDIYDKTIRIQDQKTALAVRKEKSKLLGLYPTNSVIEKEDTTDGRGYEDTAIRCHLLPFVGDDTTPTVELARLASLKLTDLLDA